MKTDSLRLNNLVKSFDDHAAIDQISLDIPKSQLTVLLGPSGCGKSTLLRMIAGLEVPTSGDIFVGADKIDHLPASARNISMVFQSYALFPHMTVADNILFGLQVRKTPKENQLERLEHVAKMMGLSELLNRKPSQLSGGQQQRVALARAIISERPICLMDEPLSNLDAKLRHEMRVEIRRLQQKLGLTMVYVTHDQVEAITIADQIVLLNKGKIEQVGSPREIYGRPATMFTAKFIGSPPMNLVSSDDLNKHLLNGDSKSFPKDTVLGIRPEDMEITKGSGIVKASVTEIEYLGADQLVKFRIGSSDLEARIPANSKLETDSELSISWQAHALHIFDRASGHRWTNSAANNISTTDI
ncbi:MAG: ABC transporter ATP-binding protein [Lentilitoribacter sp.]